jgi:hypothetical protein
MKTRCLPIYFTEANKRENGERAGQLETLKKYYGEEAGVQYGYDAQVDILPIMPDRTPAPGFHKRKDPPFPASGPV